MTSHHVPFHAYTAHHNMFMHTCALSALLFCLHVDCVCLQDVELKLWVLGPGSAVWRYQALWRLGLKFQGRPSGFGAAGFSNSTSCDPMQDLDDHPPDLDNAVSIPVTA